MVLNSCLLKSKFVLKIVDQLFILAGFNDIRESEIEHIMFVSILKMRIVISQIGQSLVLLKSIPNLVDRNFKEKTVIYRSFKENTDIYRNFKEKTVIYRNFKENTDI